MYLAICRHVILLSCLNAAASVLPTSSVSPTIHLSNHSTSFIAGMAFLGIAAAACIVALIAYVIRLRRSRSSWRFGLHKDDDVEGQDSYVNGIGMLAEKPNTTFDTPKHSNSFSDGHSIHVIPQLPSYANSPGGRYPVPRPVPPHANSEKSVDAPTQVLGPLKIKNYARGDFPSSCDESGQFSSPCAPSPLHGTPRERQAPFLGLGSGSLSLPWASESSNSEAMPTPGRLWQTGTLKGTLSDVGGRKTETTTIPPLPIPPFDSNLGLSNEGSRTDGWGATLRTSIFNALSGFTAQPKSEDKYTSFAASDTKSSERWRNTLTSRRSSALGKAGSTQAEGEIQDARSGSKALDNNLLFSQEALAINSSASTDHGLGICVDENLHGRCSPLPIPPLIIRKKSSTRSKRKMRGESFKSKVISISPRANSIYSPCPETSKLTQRLSGSISSRACSTPGGPGNSQVPRSNKSVYSSTMPLRPQFLRQPTAGSVCSFSSESSEMGDAELRVKQTLALRSRRKRTMEMGIPLGRSASTAGRKTYTDQGGGGDCV